MELTIKDSKGNPAGSVIFPWDDIKKELKAELHQERALLYDATQEKEERDAKLADADQRAEKAEAELNDVREMVQGYTRHQWIEIGVRLGFLTAPDPAKADLNDAINSHPGEYWLPEFKVWLNPRVSVVEDAEVKDAE